MAGIAIFSILAPHLDQTKLPVLVYRVVILVMAWQAWERWGPDRTEHGTAG